MKHGLWMLCWLGLLSACGSAGTATTTAVNGNNITITGSVVAGALNGTLTVRNTAGNQQTASVIGGAFTTSIPVAWITSNLLFSVQGSYRDEISAQTITLGPNTPLLAYVPANTLGALNGHLAITPETTILAELINQGMTNTNAEQLYQQVFGHVPNSGAHVFDPYATDATTAAALIAADPYAAEASFYVGVFSQWANDMGINNPTDLALFPQKLGQDLFDQRLDGQDPYAQAIVFAAGNVNIQQLHADAPLPNRLQIAISNFAHSTANVAALSVPSNGLPPVQGDVVGTTRLLTLADGTQVQVQLDANYATPFPAPFADVRNQHVFTFTDMSNNLPINFNAANSKLTSLSITPWMYMHMGNHHSTPFAAFDFSQRGQGRYIVNGYYMMPSSTATTATGQWELTLKMTDNSTAQALPLQLSFYPLVTTISGNSVLQTTVDNTADQWADMNGTIAPRPYHLWLQDVTRSAVNGYDITVYLSTQDVSQNMTTGVTSMSYPALINGRTLHDSAGNPWAVSNLTLGLWQNTVCQPLSAVNGSIGSYRITGAFGPAQGVTSTLRFCLSVNGNSMKDATASDPSLRFAL